jgi:type IV secretion system protein VirB9
MASVQWQYPNEDNSFVTQYQNPTALSRDQKISQSLNLNQMDFKYQTILESGPTPSWMPTAIFSDGQKTYIQFPKTMQEAPTLYSGENGDEIINYRVVGNYYIIDGLLKSAELASGHKNPSIVKIMRQ